MASGSDVDKSNKLSSLKNLARLRGQNEGIALFYNGKEPGLPPAQTIPAGTLVIYFAQQATLTYPYRLQKRMVERQQDQLEEEREQRKRQQDQLEEEREQRKRQQNQLEDTQKEVKRLRSMLCHEDAQ